jgi:hypothetical protein
VFLLPSERRIDQPHQSLMRVSEADRVRPAGTLYSFVPEAGCDIPVTLKDVYDFQPVWLVSKDNHAIPEGEPADVRM